MYLVYRHYIKDNTFYVGMGSKGREKHKGTQRNKIWNQIVNKNNGEYEIEILKEFNNKNEAKAYEKKLIEKYKEINQCNANIAIGNSLYGENNPMYGTNGGMFNKKHSNTTKEKISIGNKNKTVSINTRLRMSESKKGLKSPMHGKKHSKETKEKIRLSRIGKSYKCKPVISTLNDKIILFDSKKDCINYYSKLGLSGGTITSLIKNKKEFNPKHKRLLSFKGLKIEYKNNGGI